RTKYTYSYGRKTSERRFIDATNASEIGNTYETTFSYDDSGLMIRTQDPAGDGGGTITAHTYDFLHRLKTTKIGTDDGNPGNMTTVESRYYDGEEIGADGTGDGNLTLSVRSVDGIAGNDRITSYFYDYNQE